MMINCLAENDQVNMIVKIFLQVYCVLWLWLWLTILFSHYEFWEIVWLTDYGIFTQRKEKKKKEKRKKKTDNGMRIEDAINNGSLDCNEGKSQQKKYIWRGNQ